MASRIGNHLHHDGCEHCGAPIETGRGAVLRCACGSLLARHVPGGVELKCRRCKRTVVIPIQGPEVTETG